MVTGRSRYAGRRVHPDRSGLLLHPEWLAGEREADEEIAAGGGTAHESADDMFAHLHLAGRGCLMPTSRDAAAFRKGLEGPHAAAAGYSARWSRTAFVPDLMAPDRPFRPGLRIKGVKAHPNVFEMTWV